jgi:hypothetical protein
MMNMARGPPKHQGRLDNARGAPHPSTKVYCVRPPFTRQAKMRTFEVDLAILFEGWSSST